MAALPYGISAVELDPSKPLAAVPSKERSVVNLRGINEPYHICRFCSECQKAKCRKQLRNRVSLCGIYGLIFLAGGWYFMQSDFPLGLILLIVSVLILVVLIPLMGGCQDENLRKATIIAMRSAISPADQANTKDCELCSDIQREACINRTRKESILWGFWYVVIFLIIGICGIIVNALTHDSLLLLTVISFGISSIAGVYTVAMVILSRFNRGGDCIDIQNCPKSTKRPPEGG